MTDIDMTGLGKGLQKRILSLEGEYADRSFLEVAVGFLKLNKKDKAGARAYLVSQSEKVQGFNRFFACVDTLDGNYLFSPNLNRFFLAVKKIYLGFWCF